MCRFCKNWNTPCRNLQLGDVIIVGCAKYTRVGDGAEHGVPMLYCPNCGERMGGGADECTKKALKEVEYAD